MLRSTDIMRRATALLVTTGTLFASGCSLLISSELDGKGTTSGGGGQGGVETTSSVTSTSAGTMMAATSTAAQSASASASSGGGCGSECELPRAKSACIDGACAITLCNDHFGDCNAMPGDGCEINLDNDVDHCGACDNACQSDESCKGSKCK